MTSTSAIANAAHPAHSTAFLERVAVAREKVKETTIDVVAKEVLGKFTEFELYCSLDGVGQNCRELPNLPFKLVDVREDNEFAAGYILGAMHIGKGVIERDIEAKIPDKTTSIVLYCGGGYRSAIAAESIQLMGYSNVLSMDGGFRGWAEKSLPRAKKEAGRVQIL